MSLTARRNQRSSFLGIFRTTPDGKIISPHRQPWRGVGLGIYGGQAINGGSSVAQQILSSTYFQGTNLVRIAVYDMTALPASYELFINTLTQAGVVVVVEDHNTDHTVLTGTALANESNWYASMASYYINNPYVLFQSMNEPNLSDSSQQLETYSAIRNTGNNNLIFLEAGSWSNGDQASDVGDVTVYQTMHNVAWDIHGYNAYSSYSTSLMAITTDMDRRIAAMQSVYSADGIMPVVCLETGNSTDGVTVDPGGVQQVQATFQNPNVQAVSAWIWQQYSSTEADNLTLSAGGLTQMGQQVQALITSLMA